LQEAFNYETNDIELKRIVNGTRVRDSTFMACLFMLKVTQVTVIYIFHELSHVIMKNLYTFKCSLFLSIFFGELVVG